MNDTFWRRRIAAVVLSFAFSAISVGPVAAADGPVVVAQATSGTISGTVTTASGQPLGGATITLSGPSTASTTTDSTGSFSITAPPGLYSVEVAHAGYRDSSLSNIAVAAGVSQPLSVTLAALDLSSLRTIGTVTSVASGSAGTINLGSAIQSVTSAQAFGNYANPEINDVLQHTPDVVIQHLGTQQDTSIVVGGTQPYETQVLIDGHPVALGQYGVWFSQYFPSFLIGSVETQTGPGNTTPFANLAVGGTANIQTPDFSSKTSLDFTDGYDNWDSQYYNVLAKGKLGDKFSYVLGAGYSGQNNYFVHASACDAYVPSPSPTFPGLGPGPNQPGFAGIIAFCGPWGSALTTKGMVEKFKFDFSNTTSLELGFVGTYGGFDPQDSSWGTSDGEMTVLACLPPFASGALPNECTNPADAGLIGKTVNADFWYPGTRIFSNQQIWTGQLRTSVGDTTLLLRPYIGSIQPETYDAGGEWYYPAFYAPTLGEAGGVLCPAPTPGNTNFPPGNCYSGPQTYPPGTVVPPNPPANNFYGAPLIGPGGAPSNNFESNTCGALTSTAAYTAVSPYGTEITQNGQQECFQYPYDTFELDTLYGATASIVKPIQDDGYLELTYDYHGQSTYAYVNSPGNVVVPLSGTRYSTVSLTGDVRSVKNLSIPFGIYDTTWTANGQVLNNNPLQNYCPGAAAGDGSTCGLQRFESSLDPHFSMVFTPTPNDAWRVAAGSSTTFPFIGDLSGAPAFQPPADGFGAGLYTFKNPVLLPEHSMAYSAGVDHRFGNGAVISLDVSDTIVHNVFQQISNIVILPYGEEGTFTPINVATLQTKLATLKYVYAPRTGLGYNIQAAGDSSITNGVPASIMNTVPFTLPANGVQVCGTGLFTPGSATCIPYLKGYAQMTYTSPGGFFVAMGGDYEGKNNAYYQPPFAIADLTLRKTFRRIFDVQLSVQNLFNNDSYSYLPAPNLGVPVIADYSLDGKTIQQGSYPTFLLPAPTRTVRLQVRAHLGD